MIYNTVELNKHYNTDGGKLTIMCAVSPFDKENKTWKRPAIIIVPGGGYFFCSKREQEVVGFEFLSKGYNIFILEYLCAPQNARYPEQMLELACAVDYIKKNAKELNTNPKEIFAIGFSAGGHVVATLSTDYKIAEKEYSGKIDAKINGAGLIYPLISEDCFKTRDINMCGIPLEDLKKTRMQEYVCSRTVPSFIYSSFRDEVVPSTNALKYATALAENNIPYELHIYKNGGHGISVANAEINSTTKGIERNKSWINDCSEFFRNFVTESY